LTAAIVPRSVTRMTDGPKWRRRAADRPGEIAEAALAEFAAKGYAAARQVDIAARAGVSKAALYVYYPTKADLFRAVLMRRAGADAAAIAGVADGKDGFATLLDRVLVKLAETMAQAEMRKLARMVVAESGNFPELARTWHDTVVAPATAAMTGAIARAQARGEARAGDPRMMAMSVAGPMLLGVLWREVMEPIGGAPVNFLALAREHRATLVSGLIAPTGSRGERPRVPDGDN
jgi:AcrR family transcriptional regulator